MKSPGKILFWNSLVVRFGLMFTGLVLVCILVVGYLVFEQASSLLLENSKIKLFHDAQLAKQSFYGVLNEVRNDISVMANNPTMLQYVNNPSRLNRQMASRLARVILENKPEYYQLRIIDVQDGKEKLRLNKNQDRKLYETPFDQLQEKKNKEYFLNAISDSHSDYYFSKINLNEEYGKVSIPHIPTLRAVGKIRNSENNLKALLVINIDLSFLYKRLEQIAASSSQLIITDEYGQYLYSERLEKCFGDQLRHKASFDKDFQVDWPGLIVKGNEKALLLDSAHTEYEYQIDKISYSSERHSIYLFTLADLNMLLAEAKNVRDRSLIITLGICLIALLFVFIFTRYLSGSINLITRAVSDLEGDVSSNSIRSIPADRKDEVGLLARAFLKMKVRIEEQMTVLKDGLMREQKAIKVKDEFLQNMSHDIRTPLNAILGLTQLIQKNKPSDEQKPIIDSLYRSVTNLSGLMHDVLDQHKLLEGKVVLNPKPANVHDLLYDIFASYQYDAVSKGLKVSFQCDEILKQQQFLIDPLRFNQIVTNLLVNAIKYTSKGHVRLGAKFMKNGSNRLLVEVIDTGMGITNDKIDHINDRFYQAHRYGSLITDGFGLGLSIVKQLLILFDGDIAVKSTPDVGSEFIVEIPITPCEYSNEGDLNRKGHYQLPQLSNPYKILHIEDDEASQMLVRNVLNIKNIFLDQVTSKTDALKAIKSSSYALIVTDIMLNARRLDINSISKFGESTTDNVLILSALEKEEIKELSAYYLQKPFDLDNLVDKIFILLGKFEFDIPYLADIRIQYDHDSQKISKYLKILIDEYKNYIVRINKLKEGYDKNEWKAIIHKLITHVKLMRLSKMEPLLANNVRSEGAGLDELINHLKFHLCYFREELRLISEV